MRFNNFSVALVGLLSLCLAACSNLSTTDISQEDLDVAQNTQSLSLKENVDQLINPLIDDGHTPGVIVGVLLPNGDVQFFGYGVADEATGVKPSGDTLFAVGSLSKGFLGAITDKLVKDGVFSWDETLETLLPPGTPLSKDAAQITLLQLATHTSGLPRQPLTYKTLKYFVEYLFNGENFYRHFDDAYIFGYLSDFEADNPGKPHYSNIGYGLLGYIVERRTGLTVDELLKEIIVKPLGLKCTGFVPEELPCNAIRAHGYAGDEPKFIARGDPTPDWHFTPFMRGAAGVYSNARDLLNYAAAHLNGKKTKLDAVLSDTMRIRYPQPERAAAIGWVVDDIKGEPITYQIGIVAGYTSYIGIDNDYKTAVVVMQNSFNWDNSIGHRLLLSLRYREPRLEKISESK